MAISSRKPLQKASYHKTPRNASLGRLSNDVLPIVFCLRLSGLNAIVAASGLNVEDGAALKNRRSVITGGAHRGARYSDLADADVGKAAQGYRLVQPASVDIRPRSSGDQTSSHHSIFRPLVLVIGRLVSISLRLVVRRICRAS